MHTLRVCLFMYLRVGMSVYVNLDMCLRLYLILSYMHKDLNVHMYIHMYVS